MSLPAANVEDPGVRTEIVVIDQGLRDRFPASVIAIAAVAVPAVTVPVVDLVFLRLQHAMDLAVHHARQIIALRLSVKRRHHLEQLSHRSIRLRSCAQLSSRAPAEPPAALAQQSSSAPP